MAKNIVETLLGAVVLVVAGIFLVFAYSSANIRAIRGYEVTAKFERLDGINVGTDVKVSGIKVGTVTDQRLEPETFLAIVRLSVDSAIKLPVDSVAQISTEGLLGGSYIALVPGGDDKTIPPGGEIKFTQPGINVVQLLGKFIFDGASQATEPKTEPKK